MFRQIGIVFIIVLLHLFVSDSYIWSKKKKTEKSCTGGSCNAVTLQVFNNGEWTGGTTITLSKEECSSREDLGEIVCPKVGHDRSCSLFSAWGTRAASCSDLKADDNVFVVPQGRLFMLPTHGVGYRTEIQHIGMPAGKPIVIETLSENPRIFKLLNFISEQEADGLIQHALSIDDDLHKLKRSTTGAIGSHKVDNMRTSDNAFDQRSDVALAVKKRTFDILGIFPYDESFADGLQILRYNESAAYASHMDWIEPASANSADHDYNSAGEGTNRYATLLFYLTDVEEGGETVFPRLDPIPEKASLCENEGAVQEDGDLTAAPVDVYEKPAVQPVDEYIKERNISHLFKPGSWERTMLNTCRTKLAVKPKKTEAVLFYSQFPDGRPNHLSQHGGCPVVQGTKWAANLWVWNGPRSGYWKRNSSTGKIEKPSAQSISASFESRDVIGAKLYWEDQLWEELTPGRPIKVNTFGGHRWNVKLDNELLMTWTIDPQKASQRFVISSEDLPSFS